MDNDVKMVLFFSSLFMAGCTLLFFGASTMDYRIQNGSKILIDKAVYKCEKLQELDLK